MKAEREWFDPAKRSILAKTSPDSVIDVFSFILLIYHPRRIHASRVAPARICDFALASDPEGWRGPQMSSGVGTLWRRRRVERRTAVVVRCHSNRLPAMPLRTNQQSAPYHETVEGVPAENPPLRDGIVRNPFFSVNY